MAYKIVYKLKRLRSDFPGWSQDAQVLLPWPMNQRVMLRAATSRSKHFHYNPHCQKSEPRAMFLLSSFSYGRLTLKHLVGRTKITSRNMKNINIRSSASAVQKATLEKGENRFWASQSTLAITVLFWSAVEWECSVIEVCCLLQTFLMPACLYCHNSVHWQSRLSISIY